MSVRWIVFDAVGTLIKTVPDVATAYHSIGERLGSCLSRDEVADRFRAAFQSDEARDRTTDRLATDESIESDRWRRIVSAVFDDISDQERCFLELFDHFARPDSWQCFDDASATLTTLAARGYRLAVASNFDQRLHAICDSLGALPLLEVRIISSEVGWRKPASGFYAAMIDRLSAPTDSILLVGDDEVNDVIGARSAGLRAIHLDRQPGTHHRATPLDDSPISSLTELLERLP